jgi:hypothetical protein
LFTIRICSNTVLSGSSSRPTESPGVPPEETEGLPVGVPVRSIGAVWEPAAGVKLGIDVNVLLGRIVGGKGAEVAVVGIDVSVGKLVACRNTAGEGLVKWIGTWAGKVPVQAVRIKPAAKITHLL